MKCRKFQVISKRKFAYDLYMTHSFHCSHADMSFVGSVWDRGERMDRHSTIVTDTTKTTPQTLASLKKPREQVWSDIYSITTGRTFSSRSNLQFSYLYFSFHNHSQSLKFEHRIRRKVDAKMNVSPS